MSDLSDRAGRRHFLKALSLLPAAGLPSVAAAQAPPEPYRPTFFNAAQWAFLTAACDRLIPADDVGPGAIEVGAHEFIDRHMQTPYAGGAIWYMQGPFLDASASFGYQGRLPLKEIMRVGIDAVDAHCVRTYAGKRFAELPANDREAVLGGCQSGELTLDGIASKTFFTHLLAETRFGYFCDPQHGGNRGMGSWKMIGYPGPRGDFLDWVEVRDRPYPLPPVDMAGRRA